MEREKPLYMENDPIVRVGRDLSSINDTQSAAALKSGVSQPNISNFKRRDSVSPDLLASLMVRYGLSFWELCPIQEAKNRPDHVQPGEHDDLFRGFRVEDAVSLQIALVEIQRKLRESIPLDQFGEYEVISEEKDGEIIFRFKPKSK